ncbi:MAG: hypothetical protein IPJ41_02400 [Phycisphaerales bacterium]|nr:hypothetical protein [Phycisphaerales bacterium]
MTNIQARRSSAAAMISLCALAGAATAQSYEITSIGRLYGPSQGYALNASGVAAGAAIDTIPAGSAFRAFFWDGALHTVSALPGDLDSHAFSIDDQGVLYGASFTIGQFGTSAFSATLGSPVFLGEFAPRGANNFGLVVGSASGIDAVGWHTSHACAFQNGNLSALPGLGGLSGGAFAADDAGDIVGAASLPGDKVTHATLWRSGVAHDLGTLGGPRSQAFAVRGGLVAGVADTAAGDPHAFVFEVDASGAVTARHDLGVLGERASYAYGLNSAGMVVGTSNDRAFLWDGAQLIDLNTLVPTGSDWHLQAATAINDSGQIVGWGRELGIPTAFLLSPGCRADFNSDGAVDTRDVIAFLNAWSAGDSAADMDGNGLIDTRDVLAYLNLWASGC